MTPGCMWQGGAGGGSPIRGNGSGAGQAGGQESSMGVRVGQQAPDFTAATYHRGGFGSVSLSDHAGKWVLLCFYPGDFTFV